MQYVDYKYYTDTFLGKSVSADDFPTYARYASQIIYRNTYGRIKSPEALETKPYADAVKNCTCALIDRINELQIEDKAGRKASESVGPHSVSYRAEAKKTTAQLDAEYRRVLDFYLFNTGLLYQGMGCPHEYFDDDE